ncbi:MAG: hypothetical protein QX193_03265 [Methylococcales bacterium]|nr:hypothetical protein [Methylococcales bacterium]
MATRRELNVSELDAAKALQQIWSAKKDGLHLTQGKVAQICGWSNESAFGAYLHARVPLNTEAVLRLAKILKVHPIEIMPEIVDLLPLANPETGIDPVMYSKEDLDLLRVMNRVTAKQKNDTKQTLENYA